MQWLRHWEELTRHEEWNIGVVEAPAAAWLAPGFQPRVKWWPAPKRGSYRADPFAVWREGRLHVFYEEFEAARLRGRLMVAQRDGGEPQPLQGFPADRHLSYPCVFEGDGGEWYCVPEMSYRGELRLYRASAFPSQWQPEAVLLNQPAVDATIFRDPEAEPARWWLACTLGGGADANRELHLFYASAPQGPWHRHRRNPVKRNGRGARPAGQAFWHAGALYRPAQDCSSCYGGAVVLYRVRRRSPFEFEEDEVARWGPRPEWRWSEGLHTLATSGPVTLIDAKRSLFRAEECRQVLARKLRALVGGSSRGRPSASEAAR